MKIVPQKRIREELPHNHSIYDYNSLVFIVAGLRGGLRARQNEIRPSFLDQKAKKPKELKKNPENKQPHPQTLLSIICKALWVIPL